MTMLQITKLNSCTTDRVFNSVSLLLESRFTDFSDAASIALSDARSRCLLFLNQLPTCVAVSPLSSARRRFEAGFGYGSFAYQSLSRRLVFSLKQWDLCSPSQIVVGSGYFFRTLYLSTGPSGRPRSNSASR